MTRYKLMNWQELRVNNIHNARSYITLSHGRTKKNHATLYCDVFKDGTMSITTLTGGGHGEPSVHQSPLPAMVWVGLIEEAVLVGHHYFNRKAA